MFLYYAAQQYIPVEKNKKMVTYSYIQMAQTFIMILKIQAIFILTLSKITCLVLVVGDLSRIERDTLTNFKCICGWHIVGLYISRNVVLIIDNII